MHVHSATVRKQNFFLKDDDGLEHTVELSGTLAPCRDGHRVTGLRARSAERGDEFWTHFYNHDTREWHEIAQGTSRIVGSGCGGLIARAALVAFCATASPILLAVLVQALGFEFDEWMMAAAAIVGLAAPIALFVWRSRSRQDAYRRNASLRRVMDHVQGL